MIKKILFSVIALLAASPAFAQSEPATKGSKAILMIHYGTTNEETRSKTIEAINAKVAEAFPGYEVREAWTSPMVIKALAKKGIERLTPKQALLRLAADGYTDVTLQPSLLLDGVETEVMRSEAAQVAPFFRSLKLGKPLLYDLEDFQKVISVLTSRHSAAASGEGAHVVLVGHGTDTPANAVYSQTEYMLHDADHSNFHVATIEGYPGFPQLLTRLKEAGAHSVTLVPFLFVAGNHARTDISGQWAEDLRKAGYTVSTVIEGLGEIPEIQSIYIDHLHQSLK